MRELKPGHYLWIDKNGNWEEKEYWNPFNGGDAPASGAEIQQQVRNSIEDAVRCRRVSDVPLGAFLSGGIDSSVVVGNLASISEDPVTALTIGFQEKEFDGSEYSQEVADRFQTKHHVLRLDEEQLLQFLPSSLSAMDQPTIDGINTYLISRCAHEVGLKVALSGLGGDELFGGHPSFQLIPKLLQRKKLFQYIPFMKWGVGLCKGLFPSDQATKLEHWVQGKLSGAHEYFLIRALFCQDPVTHLFADPKQAQAEITKDFQRTQNLIEQFPADTAKSLLVNSMKSLLPENVWRRKKMGFTFPFEIWMRGTLRPEIESVLLSPLQQLEGLVTQRRWKKCGVIFFPAGFHGRGPGRCMW